MTERKRIEEELSLVNERFSISLRNTPITVFHQGLDLRYKWIYNPMGGHSVNQILGKTDERFWNVRKMLQWSSRSRER